jgi:hypothetical protein
LKPLLAKEYTTASTDNFYRKNIHYFGGKYFIYLGETSAFENKILHRPSPLLAGRNITAFFCCNFRKLLHHVSPLLFMASYIVIPDNNNTL